MTEHGKDPQKRSDFRNESIYPIWYRSACEDELEKEFSRSSTKDLSGGGASFELVDPKRFERRSGDMLEVQVILPPRPVFAIAKVMRIFQDGSGALCAAVMFASIEPRDKDRIVRVVLSEGLDKQW